MNRSICQKLIFTAALECILSLSLALYLRSVKLYWAEAYAIRGFYLIAIPLLFCAVFFFFYDKIRWHKLLQEKGEPYLCFHENPIATFLDQFVVLGISLVIPLVFVLNDTHEKYFPGILKDTGALFLCFALVFNIILLFVFLLLPTQTILLTPGNITFYKGRKKRYYPLSDYTHAFARDEQMPLAIGFAIISVYSGQTYHLAFRSRSNHQTTEECCLNCKNFSILCEVIQNLLEYGVFYPSKLEFKDPDFVMPEEWVHFKFPVKYFEELVAKKKSFILWIAIFLAVWLIPLPFVYAVFVPFPTFHVLFILGFLSLIPLTAFLLELFRTKKELQSIPSYVKLEKTGIYFNQIFIDANDIKYISMTPPGYLQRRLIYSNLRYIKIKTAKKSYCFCVGHRSHGPNTNQDFYKEYTRLNSAVRFWCHQHGLLFYLEA